MNKLTKMNSKNLKIKLTKFEMNFLFLNKVNKIWNINSINKIFLKEIMSIIYLLNKIT